MVETSGRYDRRNFLLNGTEGALWVAGGALISVQTVLPALLNRLGAGNVVIGSLTMISYLGVFLPQIFAARYAQTSPWKKPPVLILGFGQRAMLILISCFVMVLGADHPASAMVLTVALFAVGQVCTGLSTPIWFDLYAKLTPPGRRGRLTGMRNSIAGVIAFLGSLLLTWILGRFNFPANFSMIFLLAGVLQFGSLFLQSKLVEEYPSATIARRSLRDYLQQVTGTIRHNSGFRRLMTASVFLTLATMPLAFFTIYALRELRADGTMVGEFTLLMVAGQTGGALVNGYIADKFGQRMALSSAAIALLGASGWAVLAPTVGWFRLVYFLVGMNLGSEVMLRYNLAIEFSPPAERSTYIGLMNTLLAPLYASGLAAAWISDQFGYQTLFVVGICCSAIGIILLVSGRRSRATMAPEGSALLQ